ncbi:MAG TPA: methyltransferase domain-containing protein [Candidatus Paceibacterota bacterium]|nr:methyltransferase domain-containing protein [Candidatus Paceibacterota bacterium]
MILHPHKIIPLLDIQHGQTVLDMGSSIGFWVKPLSQIVGGSGKIIAVDNHAEIIQRLNHDAQELGLTNVHAITGDIHDMSKLSVRSGSCDRILIVRMMSVMEPKTTEILEKLSGLLNDKGQIIVIDGIHYRDELISFLSEQNSLIFWEIDEVEQRTEGHFFGMVIENIKE